MSKTAAIWRPPRSFHRPCCLSCTWGSLSHHRDQGLPCGTPKTKPQLQSLHGNDAENVQGRSFRVAAKTPGPSTPWRSEAAPVLPLRRGPVRSRLLCDLREAHGGAAGGRDPGDPGTKEPHVSKQGLRLLQGQLRPGHPKWTRRWGRAHLGHRRRPRAPALTGPVGAGDRNAGWRRLCGLWPASPEARRSPWGHGDLQEDVRLTLLSWGPPGPGVGAFPSTVTDTASQGRGAHPGAGLGEPGPQSAENCLSRGDSGPLPGTGSGEAAPG